MKFVDLHESTQVKHKEKLPAVQKPRKGGSSPHPYRGRLVGENSNLDTITSTVAQLGKDHGASGKMLGDAEYMFSRMWPDLSSEVIAKLADTYTSNVKSSQTTDSMDDAAAWHAQTDSRKDRSRPRSKNAPSIKRSVDEESMVTEGPGLIRSIAAALGLSVATWATMPSAVNTPLGQAMEKAALSGDMEARKHLKKLDFYTDEHPEMLVTLHNRYLRNE